jgi:hypothetical protein
MKWAVCSVKTRPSTFTNGAYDVKLSGAIDLRVVMVSDADWVVMSSWGFPTGLVVMVSDADWVVMSSWGIPHHGLADGVSGTCHARRNACRFSGKGVKYPLLSSDFNQNGNVSTNFSKTPHYQI